MSRGSSEMPKNSIRESGYALNRECLKNDDALFGD